MTPHQAPEGEPVPAGSEVDQFIVTGGFDIDSSQAVTSM
jgi:hypothetical protein